MWADVEPLYNELHTYVRRKLKAVYGAQMNDEDGLIEAHLLGNMWAQSWVNLYEKVKPFKEGSSIDISEGFKKNNYTVRKMFEDSNDFFTNLGLPDNQMSYEFPSVIEKPPNKTITCHARYDIFIMTSTIFTTCFFSYISIAHGTFAMEKISESKCAQV